MADKPVAEVVDVDAVIDALSPSPSSSDVYEATLPFNPHAVAASAVRRAGEGGGGGGGGVSLKGPYSATHSTPSIGTDGALMTTLSDGDLLLETFVYFTTTWENSGGVYVYLGDPNVSPQTLWAQIADPSALPSRSYSAPDSGPKFIGSSYLVGPGLSEGGVYVQTSNTVTAGALDLYLLVGTPTLA